MKTEGKIEDFRTIDNRSCRGTGMVPLVQPWIKCKTVTAGQVGIMKSSAKSVRVTILTEIQ